MPTPDVTRQAPKPSDIREDRLHRIHPDTTSRLRLSESTVKLLVRTGKLRSVLIGRARRVPESAIGEFIANLASVDANAKGIRAKRFDAAESNEEDVPDLFTLTKRELATMLAALRLWQLEQLDGGSIPADLQIIADGAGPPLRENEIDALYEALNTSPRGYARIEDAL